MLQLALLAVAAAAAAATAPPFRNAGTPPNVSRSYDCESRRHAWEFARATLPQRGQFRSAFDALQLQACDLDPPAAFDEYVPPTFPTPASESGAVVLYAGACTTAVGMARTVHLPFTPRRASERHNRD